MNRIFILNNGLHGAYYAILQSDSIDYRKLILKYFVTYSDSPMPVEIKEFCKETENLEKQSRKYINSYNLIHDSNFVLWSY